MALKEIGAWRIITLDDYESIIKTLNTLKLKKEQVLKIDRDEETGKITMIYFW